MKKRLISIAAAALLVASMGTMAFAENTAGGETQVTYEVAKTYTVTIPGTANISTATETLSFSAENVKLDQNEIVEVKVNSTLTNGEVQLTSEKGATANAILKIGGTVVTDQAVASFDNAGTASTLGAVTLDAPASTTFAGKYSGTITFDVKVVASTPAP